MHEANTNKQKGGIDIWKIRVGDSTYINFIEQVDKTVIKNIREQSAGTNWHL